MSVYHLRAGAHGIFWRWLLGGWELNLGLVQEQSAVFSALEHGSRGQPPKPVLPSYHVGTHSALAAVGVYRVISVL